MPLRTSANYAHCSLSVMRLIIAGLSKPGIAGPGGNGKVSTSRKGTSSRTNRQWPNDCCSTTCRPITLKLPNKLTFMMTKRRTRFLHHRFGQRTCKIGGRELHALRLCY